MASILCVLYYVYKTGIVASNMYSFMTFSKVMYPYVKEFGDRIPYQDIEQVKEKIIQTYYEKVFPVLTDKMKKITGKTGSEFTFPSNFVLGTSEIDDSWVDLKTHRCVKGSVDS